MVGRPLVMSVLTPQTVAATRSAHSRRQEQRPLQQEHLSGSLYFLELALFIEPPETLCKMQIWSRYLSGMSQGLLAIPDVGIMSAAISLNDPVEAS